ncbi:hypothetical protein KY330_04050 [Candidatus Woesearchaeota archaeon]|nr:hypothetical protein [Candidatus Woesearchaeota archaeon]
MRRKIIKQGNNSFTLTLPVKWIRRNRLEGGDEVFLSDNDGELVVLAEEKHEKKETRIKIREAFRANIKYLLGQVYRQGYDEITVVYDDENVYKEIVKVIDYYFLGLEIIDRKEGQCKIGVIVETTEEKFKIFLRKMFQLVHESISLLKDKGDMEEIESYYSKLSQYQNYGKRFIYSAKTELSNYDYYSLLSYFINIHADIHRVSQILSKSKVVYNAKIKSNYENLLSIWEAMESAFYKKDKKELVDINKKLRNLIQESLMSKGDLRILHYQMELFRLFYGAVSPMLGILFAE